MPIAGTASNRLLIEVRQDSKLGESMKRAPQPPGGLESLALAAPSAPTLWGSVLSAGGSSELHPWDQAHRSIADPHGSGLEAAPAYAEPDFVQAFPYQGPDDLALESFGSAGACVFRGPDAFWPP